MVPPDMKNSNPHGHLAMMFQMKTAAGGCPSSVECVLKLESEVHFLTSENKEKWGEDTRAL